MARRVIAPGGRVDRRRLLGSPADWTSAEREIVRRVLAALAAALAILALLPALVELASRNPPG
jgi:hypothetical protein